MKAQKKTKSRKSAATTSSKKTQSRPRAKANGAAAVPLFDHRAIEHRFIEEHPEAFDPYVGQWVVLEGTSIVAHGPAPATIADEARSLGIRVPYLLKVLPKLKPNEGYL